MELTLKLLKKKFPEFEKEFLEEMIQYGTVKEIPKNTELIRYGQYLKALPLVLKGTVKVYSNFEEKEFLLYYIKPDESCIMSLSAILNDTPSKVSAVTGLKSDILLFPVDKVKKWINKYSSFTGLFFSLYDRRYNELIETLNQVLFQKLDKRLTDYLANKKEITGLAVINITHKKIAEELGTAREVVSRILKKLETSGKIEQGKGYIKLLKI